MPASFAIVPAAGRSIRMGAPKLLLPWNGRTIIEQVLAAWRASLVDKIVVVLHPEDRQLAALCGPQANLVVVAPEAPPDMKASVLIGLEALAERFSPGPSDVWLVAPADIPQLSSPVIDRLLAEHRPAQPAILVPVHQGKRGHPVLFPWPLAAGAAALPGDCGINRLLSEHPVREIAGSVGAIAPDIDTPEQYDQLSGE